MAAVRATEDEEDEEAAAEDEEHEEVVEAAREEAQVKGYMVEEVVRVVHWVEREASLGAPVKTAVVVVGAV